MTDKFVNESIFVYRFVRELLNNFNLLVADRYQRSKKDASELIRRTLTVDTACSSVKR